MNENLNTLTINYVNNLNLTATVINPFSTDSSIPETTQFTIICDKCDSIWSSIDCRDEFDKIVAETLRIA